MAIASPANRPVLLSNSSMSAVNLSVFAFTVLEETESPTRLVAITVKVYVVAGSSPSIEITPEPS